MAPVIDKRPQPLSQNHSKETNHMHLHNINHVHDHNHSLSPTHMHTYGHGHLHAHENMHNQAKENRQGKGLEILDFHESWLEEVQLYSGKGVTRKNMHHPLLLAHNEALMSAVERQNSKANNNNFISHQNSIATKINNAISNVTDNNDINGKVKMTDRAVRNRAMMRDSAVAAATVAAAAFTTDTAKTPTSTPNLKRVRDDNSSLKKTTNNHGKRLALTHSNQQPAQTFAQGHSQSTIKTGNGVSGANGTGAGSVSVSATGTGSSPGTTTFNPSTSSSTTKQVAKIVVNQFHAVNLLNAHQNEEKTKILTQNGLTKSAATAYETSMYASHYLPCESRVVKQNDRDRLKEACHEEDPCAAIDDINDYSDSDSEEEYIGFPFFLEEDGDETHQSRNIRCSEEPLRIEEEDTTNCALYYTPRSILSPSLFPNVPPYLNFSSHVTKGPPMPIALHKVLKWKLSPVMPKIVKRVVLNSGFRIIRNTTDWMAIWEKHMKSPGFRTIRSHQKYNHMPGSFRIGRKDTMWRGIYNNIKKFSNKEFGFMQKSYIMPDDLENLRLAWPKNASKLTKWIVKPPASARGTGIRIVNKWSQFPKDRPLVVQKYIERPLLINDNKFDMRLYVVVTSINPLRIYMYKDGLARFASVKYSSELNCLDDRCMHLTNYSINKYSQNYSKNEDFNACQGHKWTLQSLWCCLENRGVNTKRLWATLRNLVIKSIISGESGLNRMYRQNVNFRYNCFELFGFDVLLDENIVPWLLEINISPSLHSELPLDLHVKGPLIQAVLNTALYQVPPKFNEAQQNEILEELHMHGPLCYDKRIFSTCLTAEEVHKHNSFTNRLIEFREEYLDTILDHLLPDDIRCLIIAEDEYARCKPLERIFPTSDTYTYLKYIDNPRYYNRLLDAWEHRYGNQREEGIARIKRYCEDGYHLQVPNAALEKEPDVVYTEIDMLHTKKSEDVINPNMDPTVGDSGNASKAGTPD